MEKIFQHLLGDTIGHQVQPDSTSVSSSGARKRGRGRPPKLKSEVQLSVDLNDVTRRQRGRPRKGGGPATTAATPTRRIGRSRKSANVGKPQGRAKRENSGATAEEGEVVPPRKRGRPPKTGGPVRRSARPVGRPRKEASLRITETPRQEVAEYGKLKRKYERLQVKVKEAVSLLKATALAVKALEEANIE